MGCVLGDERPLGLGLGGWVWVDGEGRRGRRWAIRAARLKSCRVVCGVPACVCVLQA